MHQCLAIASMQLARSPINRCINHIMERERERERVSVCVCTWLLKISRFLSVVALSTRPWDSVERQRKELRGGGGPHITGQTTGEQAAAQLHSRYIQRTDGCICMFLHFRICVCLCVSENIICVFIYTVYIDECVCLYTRSISVCVYTVYVCVCLCVCVCVCVCVRPCWYLSFSRTLSRLNSRRY